MASVEGEGYIEKPALEDALGVGLQSALAGFFVSAVQNSLQTHNKGAMGVITRTGGSIALFGKLPGSLCVFAFVASPSRRAVRRNDSLSWPSSGVYSE
jgi:hypothetical protein